MLNQVQHDKERTVTLNLNQGLTYLINEVETQDEMLTPSLRTERS